MNYNVDENAFSHTANGESNAISTSQAFYAVSVMYQQKNGKADKPVFQETETSISSEPSKEISVEPSKTVSQTTSQDSSSNNNSNNTVPTGDTQNFILIFGSIIISASAVFVLARKKKED